MATRVLVLGGSSYVAQFVLQRHMEQSGGRHGGNSTQARFVMACTMRGQPAPSTLPVGFATASPEAEAKAQVQVYWGVDLVAMAGVRECVRDFRPDVVVNCVAMSSPAACEKEPVRAKAINEPRELIEFLGHDVAWNVRFVHFSTDFVYDGANPPALGYKESDARIPQPPPSSSPTAVLPSLTAYGASKLAFDECLRTQQLANVSVLVLRIANVIGPQSPLLRDQPPKFMEWMHQQLFRSSSGDEKAESPVSQLRLWSDEVRSFVYVRDLAAVLFALLDEEVTPASRFLLLNIGGVDALSRVELAERYLFACQRANPQTLARAQVAPTSRASVDLGYHPPLNAHLDSSLLRQQLPSLALTPTDQVMDEISRELLDNSTR